MSTGTMVKDQIAAWLRAGIDAAQASGALPQVDVPDLGLVHPPQVEMGDFASSVPMRMARAARKSPRDIASSIVDQLEPNPAVATIEIAGNGFINITLTEDWLRAQVAEIERAGDAFGTLTAAEPKKIQVEFVSANPVGPIHVGNGRGAVLGDGIASVLAAAGHTVQREYYINDAGAQIGAFGRTLLARYKQAFGIDAPVPEDGYNGAYMVDLAGIFKDRYDNTFLGLPEAEAVREMAEIGMKIVLEWIKEDTERLGVHFDEWFSERSLVQGGKVAESIARLKEAGYTDERADALWFSSTALGEDKDNVIIRSNGSPTYFATDIAYHDNKLRDRGFDLAIDVWGADHQGHVSRMKAVVGALGFSPDQLIVVLAQLVTLKRGGEPVRISKRTGDIITLREVLDEVGGDAVRYFFLQRSADSQMDFDLDLAKDRSDKNPVYYIQYAHARIASILRNAAEKGIDYANGDVSLLTHQAELRLIRKMIELPEQVEQAAERLQPQNLPEYAYKLAAAFTDFYHQCRVISDDEALTMARLRLAAVAMQTLANTLRLMGMTTPERMDRAEGSE